jgi:hypothetical protein
MSSISEITEEMGLDVSAGKYTVLPPVDVLL